MSEPIVPTIHTEHSLYATPHAVSWLFLAFAAGSVNAGAYLVTERFASHVTGTISLIGLDYDKGWLLLEYLLVFLAFVIGAALPVLLFALPRKANKRAPYWLPLAVVSLILIAAAVLGSLGLLGEMNQAVESGGDFVLLGMLSFAMGIQNGSVSASTRPMVRTTHLTGDTTDLGTEIALAFVEKGETRRRVRRAAWLRAGKIGMFILGAAAMAALEPHYEYLSFFMPAALVALAAMQSFASPIRHSQDTSQEPIRPQPAP